LIKKMNIILEIDNDLPRIIADQKLIQIIMQNLISNAIDACHENGTIVISTHIDSNGIFSMKVQDNGCGISKEDQAKMFKPLFSTKKKMDSKHIGMGMVSVLKIVNAYKGKIELESKINEGTKFNILLPMSA